MNYEQLLEDAVNADVKYPNMIKTPKVWRIKENSTNVPLYLGFSFVGGKNLDYPELGFNLIKNHSRYQHPICFLSKDDAVQFYNIYIYK